MTIENGPLWPIVDPDVAPVRRSRRRFGYAVLVPLLVLALAVPAAGFMAPRTISGTALPAPVTATSATTTTPPPSATTPPPARRIFLLADHPLLASGVALPEANCVLPAFRRQTANLKAYYQALIDCMDRTWQPVLAANKLPHEAPGLNVEEHPGETGCGNPDKDDIGEFTALYCPADHTLYLPVDRLKNVDHGESASHIAVVAHEYGHHVQELSGMLMAASKEIDKAGEGTPKALELSRRTELQANCLAGLFIAAAAGKGTIPRGLAEQAIAEFNNGALPETHGTRANQAAWAKKGYQKRTTAACNTWSALPGHVG